MPQKKKDWAALARQRDEAAAATGPQPAAPPAAPAPGPSDSAGRAGDAGDRAKLAEETAAAEIAMKWFDAAFYDDPTGALKSFLDLAVDGITAGRYTEQQALQWIHNPANAHEIQTILSFSVPGQRVFLDDLESWNPDAVVRTYMQGLFDSVNGDPSLLAKIGDLSLKDAAAPAPAQVRRASLLPSAAL